MVVKSKNDNYVLQDIAETFAILGVVNMKLYPQKCIFGKEEAKLLGNVITKDGIKANPKKIEVLCDNPGCPVTFPRYR